MNNNTRIFSILVSVFFFWGFVAASNDILIPVFKSKMGLKQWESQMIAFAFYVAYTIGSLIYIGLTKFAQFDMVKEWGYGKTIATGLFISAAGTILFIPASSFTENPASAFPLVLIGLMIVGIGFAFQQTAANPLAILLGSPNTGSQRLSMAGGINNVGTTIGPLIVNFAIFGAVNSNKPGDIDLSTVKLPYLVLGALFVVFGMIFWRLNSNNQENSDENEEKTDKPINSIQPKSALSFPQLWMGMIAIFLYVGVEVSTASNLPEYMKSQLNLNMNDIAPYISLFWASLMIGRWTSAAQAFNLSNTVKSILRWVLPLIAYGIYMMVNFLPNKEFTQFEYLGISAFWWYQLPILLLIILDWVCKGNPARQLAIYSIAAIAMLFVGMFIQGTMGMFALISVGLFCSTLWPSIFALAISGLGKSTGQGSNLLIMMIMGGGFISVLQGRLADEPTIGIEYSYWVGVVCFAYLFYYAVATSRNLKKQGIELETPTAGH
jgi:FHS family L-fucose permease-like MFS transporter